jgi:hypothetical protein
MSYRQHRRISEMNFKHILNLLLRNNVNISCRLVQYDHLSLP